MLTCLELFVIELFVIKRLVFKPLSNVLCTHGIGVSWAMLVGHCVVDFVLFMGQWTMVIRHRATCTSSWTPAIVWRHLLTYMPKDSVGFLIVAEFAHRPNEYMPKDCVAW